MSVNLVWIGALLGALQGPVELQSEVGTSPAFQSALSRASLATEGGDFKLAKSIAAAMPDLEVRYAWKEENVPVNLRATFAKARDEAFAIWKAAIPELRFVRVNQGEEVSYDFAPSLPPNVDSPGPAGAVHLQAYQAPEPSVDTVLALQRTERKLAIGENEVHNEVLFSIAAHFGISRAPRTSIASARQETLVAVKHRVIPYESNLAKLNVETTKKLRDAVSQEQKVVLVSPNLNLSARTFDLPSVVQGESIPFELQISNTGSGALNLMALPDCGCVIVNSIPPLLPGQSYVVKLNINTSEWPGEHLKYIYLYSNDPENALTLIPVKFTAEPIYRFLKQDPGPPVFQISEDGILSGLFLEINPKSELKIENTTLNGRDGAVSLEPWEGEMADPELREGPRKRKGYAIKMLLSPDIGMGRVPLTLELFTNDRQLRVLRYSFFIQRGIAVVPQRFYLGELGAKPLFGNILISRPGKPFHVKSIASSNPLVLAKIDDSDREDQRLVVYYRGGAPEGEFESVITVQTDDPDQPEIQVTVTGVGKPLAQK